MDENNLENLMTIIDLLDGFKERVTRQATGIQHVSSDEFLRQDSSGLNTWYSFGEKVTTSSKKQREETLARLLSHGRSFGFMGKIAQTKHSRSDVPSKEEDEGVHDSKLMTRRAMSRASQAGMRRGRRRWSQSTTDSLSTENLQRLRSSLSIESDNEGVGKKPSKESFLNRKVESGLLTDPEGTCDSAEDTTAPSSFERTPTKISFSGDTKPPKKQYTFTSEKSTDSWGDDVISKKVRAKLIDKFGQEFAAMCVAAASPDVLYDLLTRIMEYVKVDLHRLLDEMVMTTKQTEIKLKRMEVQLQEAIDKAEDHESEAAQVRSQLNDLRRSKEASERDLKFLQSRQEELEAEKEILLNQKSDLELRTLKSLQIQKTKDEELETLRDILRYKDAEELEEGLKLAKRGSSLASTMRAAKSKLQPELTLPVFKDILPSESGSEESQDSVPTQPLIFDQMKKRLEDLEAQLKTAELARKKLAKLEEIVEDMKMKAEAAEREKSELKRYIKQYELEKRNREEFTNLEKQLKEYEERVKSLEKAEQDATIQAGQERQAANELRIRRDQLVSELEQLKQKFEKEEREIRDKHHEEMTSAQERWNKKDQELKQEYDLMFKEFGEAKTKILEWSEKIELAKQQEKKLKDAESLNQSSKAAIMQLQKELTQSTTDKDTLLLEMRTKVQTAENERDQLKARMEDVEEGGTDDVNELRLQIEFLKNDVLVARMEASKKAEEDNQQISELEERLRLIPLTEDDSAIVLRRELNEGTLKIKELEQVLAREKEAVQELIEAKDEIDKKLSVEVAEKNKVREEADKSSRDQEIKMMALEEKINMLTGEQEQKIRVIGELNDDVERLSEELEATQSLVEEMGEQLGVPRLAVKDDSAEEELARKHEEELTALKTANERLSRDVEEAKRGRAKQAEAFNKQSKSYEQQLAKQKEASSEEIEELKQTVSELRETVSELMEGLRIKEAESNELTETCNSLSLTIKTLEEEKESKLEGTKGLEVELIKLRDQFLEFRAERKTTEDQLARILERLQGREMVSVEVGSKIKELQESLKEANEVLGLTTQELRNEKRKTSQDEESLRIAKQKQEGIARLLEDRTSKEVLWLNQLDQFRNENVQLRGRLKYLTSLLSSLNERLAELQRVNRPPQCCQFLLDSCYASARILPSLPSPSRGSAVN